MEHSNVTVIIPTTAEKLRAVQLRRCLQSIRDSSVCKVQIIAVVNGARYDVNICSWLKAQDDVVFHYLETPSAPNAVLEGRKLVKTEFFSTLDDDDEYLKGATDRKLLEFAKSCDTDMVVTNSCFPHEGGDKLIYHHLGQVPAQPLAALFVKNWLNSGNALYRSASIDISYFENFNPFAEWTWLAFKIGMEGKKLLSIDDATHRIHATPGSLSFSDQYFDAYLGLFDRMLSQAPPAPIAHLILRRKSASLHDISTRALKSGKLALAISSHMRSLFLPGGRRYLRYTVRIVVHQFMPRFSAVFRRRAKNGP